MDKRGKVVAYLPFKQYVIIILVIIFLVFLYYLFVMQKSSLSIASSCPEEIVSKNISLQMYTGVYSQNSGLDLSTDPSNPSVWEDGVGVGIWAANPLASYEKDIKYSEWVQVRINGMPYNPPCVKGSKEGENLNYYYCKNLAYRTENTEISENGEIGKTKIVQYEIDLVVKKAEVSSEEEVPIQIAIQRENELKNTYEIIDAKCKRVNY